MISIGKTINIKCYSFNIPTWKFKPFLVNKNRVFNERSLGRAYIINGSVFIRVSRYENSGIYECHGTTPNGDAFKKKAEVYVGSKGLG